MSDDASRTTSPEPTDADAPTMRLGDPAAPPPTSGDQATARATGGGSYFPNVPPKLGPYDLIRVIGHGGMGVVYEAIHEKLRTTCAVKVLIAGTHASPEEIARFQREAVAVARMGKHPNIVAVHDLGEQGNLAYYAMDLAEGTSLRKRLDAGPFAPKEATALVEKVARALHFAHERGVIHRDMKPDNVMVRSDLEPQVMDFGLARDVASTQRLSVTGQIMGTLAYMAPEQARGDVDRQDARTDVYALGGILYEMLTRRVPHPGTSAAELLPRILEGAIVPPRRVRPDLPRDLETICMKCLALDPERRYATAQALADDLARYRRGDPILARPVSLLARVARSAVRHRAVVIPSAIAALLGIAFLAYVQVSRSLKAATIAALAQARDERSAMEQTLGKAERVSAVWGRWLLLAPSIADLERVRYDQRLTLEARRARCASRWKDVERFMAETPPDVASQATMKALAGWCRRLAGYDDEGLSWMREAAALDAEVPYGALLEALLWFSEYTELQDMPTVGMDPKAGVHFGEIRAESDEMIECRGRIEPLLERMKGSRVWGKGASEQFAGALRALRAVQDRKLVDAEADLSQSIGAPDLAPFRIGLLVARAKVRYLLKRFDEALSDLEEARTVRDGRADVHAYLGLMRMARAIEGLAKKEDPRPLLERAIEDFHAALARREDAPCFNSRAHAYKSLAEVKVSRGLDPREDYRKALADYASAIRCSPDEAGTYANRGNLWGDLAMVEAGHGEDSMESWKGAIADYDAALRAQPDFVEALVGRGLAYMEVGTLKTYLGQDPREDFQKAIGDGDRAVALRPDLGSAWHNRGTALMRMGENLLGSTEDPTDLLRRAIADFDVALDRSPSDVDGLVSRGTAQVMLGMAETAAGKDARETFRLGIGGLDAGLQARPGDPYILNNRGNALRYLADAERAQGADARETYRKGIADLDAAVAGQPDNPEIRSARGDVWFALAVAEAAQGADPLGSYAKAREDIEAVLRAYPRNGSLLGRLGQVLEGLGELEKAVEVYKRAIAASGDPDPALRELLAGAEARLRAKSDPK